jgi:SAM-dependent methyltransferase
MVHELGVSVLAADPSPGMLQVARQQRTLPEVTYQLIGDDQGLDQPEDSVDAAVSCFVFVCISEAERIQKIVSEVYRLLRPGATYAMLELNPDMAGVPFQIGVMGEAGREYGAGEPIEIRLSTPGAEPMAIVDYHWPKQVQVGFLETAGFRNVRVEEPTLPAEYDGPGADRMVVERTHPPYTIYLAEK